MYVRTSLMSLINISFQTQALVNHRSSTTKCKSLEFIVRSQIIFPNLGSGLGLPALGSRLWASGFGRQAPGSI